MAITYNNRGIAHGGLEQHELAVADYTKAIELDPSYIGAYYDRALAQIALGDREQALADLNKALSLGPDPMLTLLIQNVINSLPPAL